MLSEAPPLEIALLPERPLRRENGLLYQQLAAILRAPIASGAVAAGAELPTEASLATRFGVSLITVRQALRELESQGLIRKRAAKAAVVATPERDLPPVRAMNSFADIGANTAGGRLHIKSYRKERSREASEAFGLSMREACWCLRGLLFVRGQATAQITIYFPPEIGARLKRSDFDDVVVFHSLERRLGIRLMGARARIGAELADAELARDLDYQEGAPVLVMQLLYRALDERPVELTIARHRADRFSIAFDVPNQDHRPYTG